LNNNNNSKNTSYMPLFQGEHWRNIGLAYVW
jgi:hypothetical protein